MFRQLDTTLGREHSSGADPKLLEWCGEHSIFLECGVLEQLRKINTLWRTLHWLCDFSKKWNVPHRIQKNVFLNFFCIENLTLFLSYFSCLLFCVQISNPIVNCETSFLEISENSAILESCPECSLEQLHSGKSAGVYSVLCGTLRIFWQERLRRTLQNFPECLIVWLVLYVVYNFECSKLYYLVSSTS